MRSIDRRQSVAIIIGVVLILGAGTVAALTTVSINQSSSDFLDGEVSGGASVESDDTVGVRSIIGSTAESGEIDQTSVVSKDRGVVIEPETDLEGLRVGLFDGLTQDSDLDEDVDIELRQMDGTVIASVPSEGQEVKFDATLNANTEYIIVLTSDTSISHASSTDEDFPIESNDLNINSGWSSGSSSSILYNIKSVTAIESAARDGSYSGSHDVSKAAEVFAEFQTFDGGSATVEWKADGETIATETVTSAGEVTKSVSETDSAPITIEVTYEPDVDSTQTVTAEGVRFESSDPIISNPNPSDEETATETPVELRIDVDDEDFNTDQGDEVDVVFYDASDDTQIGTDTLTSAGTATATFDEPVGGENNWYAVATDDYGNEVTSSTFAFNTPAEIEVRNEEDPDQLLADVDDMTIEFYQQTGDTPDAIESVEVTKGTADMTGLQADASFIAVAEADGFANRRIFIDSLIETQTIYLLNKTSDKVTVEYELEDFSGQYPQSETVMVIEKNINDEWTPIQGDFFGSTGKFEAQLLRDTRHRMRVVNVETGDERVIGAFTPPQDALETVTILPDGSITVDDGFEQIFAQPAIGSISAAEGAEFGVELREGSEQIESWDIEVTLMHNNTETTLATRSGTGTSTETFDLDLRDAAGGSVIATVEYETNATSGTVRLSRQVRENYPGAEGLVGGLITIGDGLGADGEGHSGASMLASLFVSLLITAGVARVSTSADTIGLAALMSVSGFAIIGWVPFTLLFAATVGFGAVIVLRRGI